MQKLETDAESNLRALQSELPNTWPHDLAFQPLPVGLFNQSGRCLHYLAAWHHVREATPGTCTVGQAFAWINAKPSEWESLKAHWLVAARTASPLGKDDPYLYYDGTEGSAERGGGGGGGGGGRTGGGGGGHGK